jgi:hypothetical protein
MHNTGDPENSSVVLAMVAEDNGKDDATQIACRASETRDDAYRPVSQRSNFRWSLQYCIEDLPLAKG